MDFTCKLCLVFFISIIISQGVQCSCILPAELQDSVWKYKDQSLEFTSRRMAGFLIETSNVTLSNYSCIQNISLSTSEGLFIFESDQQFPISEPPWALYIYLCAKLTKVSDESFYFYLLNDMQGSLSPPERVSFYNSAPTSDTDMLCDTYCAYSSYSVRRDFRTLTKDGSLTVPMYTGLCEPCNASCVVGTCGGNFTEMSGYFASPNHPGSYPNKVTCLYQISLPIGERIAITFETFNTESCCDKVKLYEGSTTTRLITTLSGTYNGFEIASATNEVLVEFSTDRIFSNLGFRAHYKSFDNDTCIAGNCGENLTDVTGYLASPSFPSWYPHNSKCLYHILQPLGNRIALTFDTFHIMSGDYVKVYEGSTRINPIGSFNGANQKYGIISQTNEVLVEFTSDASVSGAGFSAYYSRIDPCAIAKGICGGNFTELTGYFTSPNFPSWYPPNTKCLYHILLPLGNRIALNFDTINMPSWGDFIKVYEGSSKNNIIETFRGHICSNSGGLVSQTNEILVEFISDSSVAGAGFSAYYYGFDTCALGLTTLSGGDTHELNTTSCSLGVCGMTFTELTGHFASPNFPSWYPPNSKCLYHILLPVGNRIALHFDSINTPNSRDFVKVYEGSTTTKAIGMFYGVNNGNGIISKTNEILVEFTSDNSLSGVGFSAYYYGLNACAIDFTVLSGGERYGFNKVFCSLGACGGNFTELTGYFASPSFPSWYPPNSNCLYHIRLPVGKRIALSFDTFSMPCCDTVKVFEGSTRSNVIATFLRYTNVYGIISHTNEILVEFISGSSDSGTGFSAYYYGFEACAMGLATSVDGGICELNTSSSSFENKTRTSNCCYDFCKSACTLAENQFINIHQDKITANVTTDKHGSECPHSQ